MADTLVEGGASSALNALSGGGIFGPYWISTSTGAIIYIDGNSDVVAKKTTDGGSSWSSASAAEAGSATALAAFFDREMVSDTGTKIHAVWVDDVEDDFTYAAYDIDAGTWSSPVDIDAATSVSTASTGHCHIAKTRAGGFVASYLLNNNSTICYKSDDGATWDAATSPMEIVGVSGDVAIGVVVDTGDTKDSGVVYWDVSVNEVSVKMYDDSADTWTETSVVSATEAALSIAWGRATRISDGHTILAVWSETDSATADLLVFDLNLNSIASPTITQLTNVLTDTSEAGLAGVFVDPNTDDIYVAYALGATFQSTVNVYYKKSTDDGSSWGTQAAYGEDTDDDIRVISGGACGTAGGRFQPAFFNDDLNDIFVNLTNDIEIAAAAGGDPEGSLIRGKLIRGGLLRGGVLVG